MSRTDFFVVISADTDDFDPEDADLQADLTKVVANAVETSCTWPTGPADVRVIDARQSRTDGVTP